jgi:hypothetical protein
MVKVDPADFIIRENIFLEVGLIDISEIVPPEAGMFVIKDFFVPIPFSHASFSKVLIKIKRGHFQFPVPSFVTNVKSLSTDGRHCPRWRVIRFTRPRFFSCLPDVFHLEPVSWNHQLLSWINLARVFEQFLVGIIDIAIKTPCQ